MPPKGHALLSASSSERWLRCPPSARLCENYEDKGSDFAAEGTDAHALCEYKLRRALGMDAADPTENLVWFTEEMDDCAAGYAAYVLEQVELAKQSCTDPVVLVEQRVDFSRWVESGFGTSDAIIIADGTMTVCDYKHGRGIMVDAHENPQMMCYGLGALELFDGIYDIDTVRMIIYQPRRDIRGMAYNEKYVGDALFQKTYTDEHFNHRRNNGEKEQYLIQNHHEPIISRKDFEAAQAVIAQRAREKGIEKRDGKNQNSYPFSGKIICGNCGGTFKRRIHASGKHRVAWCCTTHLTDIAECPVKYIPDSALEVAFVTMMNKLIFGHQTVLRPLLVSLRGITSDSSLKSIGELDKRLEDNTEQRKVLVGLLTKGYLEPAVYNKGNNELLQEAERIQKQKESLLRFMNNDRRSLSEVSAILQYATKATMLKGFDGELFTRFVERIHVYSRTEIGFELKCGIILKERLVI